VIHHANASWPDVRPKLSILIPFLRDDPTPLLESLSQQQPDQASQLELILLDDGTNDPILSARLVSLIQSMPIAGSLITLTENSGRASGRNLLARKARGEYLLFLDADMRPDGESFVADWLALIDNAAPEIAFGGFSVDLAPRDPAYEVHRAMAAKSDCLPAVRRSQQPEKYVFTSNLLVRSDIFARTHFDERFTGWGWEDVEWAMRVSSDHVIQHHDIPATHLGLDTVPQLMAKYRQSASNFAKVAARHPTLVATYPSYKIARIIRAASLEKPIQAVSHRTAACERLPVGLRALALRFYRASLYAEALRV